jgi:hypothetical protein
MRIPSHKDSRLFPDLGIRRSLVLIENPAAAEFLGGRFERTWGVFRAQEWALRDQRVNWLWIGPWHKAVDRALDEAFAAHADGQDLRAALERRLAGVPAIRLEVRTKGAGK